MKFYKPLLVTTLALLTTSIGASAHTHHHVHNVHTRVVKVYNTKQLRKALDKKGGWHHRTQVVIMKNLNQPNRKKMYLKNTGYSLKEYLNQYNPKVYGKHRKTKGLMENARKQAENNQKKDVEIKVPAYTTITSSHNRNKSVNGINFITNGDHIMFNHLDMQAPVDDFPQWDGTDGKQGNWNSAFDAISIKNSKHDAVRNSNLTDGTNADKLPSSLTFNRQYQQHDGLTDITDGSNYVTLSRNTYSNHDKAILIGNSDKRTSDKGKLNVWMNHNRFINVSQRMPRVRYGHVHLNNNHIYSNNLQPYALTAIFEDGKDGHIAGHENTINVKNIQPKQLMKKVAQAKNSKSLKLDKTAINGTTYNIYLKRGKVVYKPVKMNKKIVRRNSNKKQHKAKISKKAQKNEYQKTII